MDLFKLLANPPFPRVRRRFYEARDVDAYLRRVREEAESLRRDQEHLAQQLQEKDRLLTERAQELSALRIRVEGAPAPPAAGELVIRASDQANAIVASAMTQREHIMESAAQQRSRAMAASRAMYYNALQFKQEMARQFRGLEQEMDTALDALCGLDGAVPVRPPEPPSKEE